MQAGGWLGGTPWHLGGEHGSAVPSRGWQCHSAFDWVGASQSFASVYPVCAGGYNPLRRALWVEVARSGTWRLTSLLPSPFMLEPHSLSSQTKWTLATPSFWSKQVLNSCNQQSTYKPILISHQLSERQIIFCSSEPMSTIKIPKLWKWECEKYEVTS